MALNTSKCNHLTPLFFKGLKRDGRRSDADRLSTFVLASLDVAAPSCRRSIVPTTSIIARRGSLGAGVESEYTSEGASKVWVEDGVDDRVEETVDIAEPGDEADDGRRDGSTTARAAERSDGGDDKERKPTDYERAGDDGQRPRRLPLSPSASSTLPVTTQFCRVTPWRRTSPRQNFKKVVPDREKKQSSHVLDHEPWARN